MGSSDDGGDFHHDDDCGDPISSSDDSVTVKLRMLEFFSGIGGMRISLDKALKVINTMNSNTSNNINDGDNSRTKPRRHLVLESCRAYDISLHANKVYQHNFDDNDDNPTSRQKKKRNNNSVGVRTKLVEQLTPNDVAPFRANLWTMSPPCQPFTTSGEGRGKQRLDASDKRCNGLKGILKLLDGLQQRECSNSNSDSQLPRWILLENVKGFADSEMCELFCDCLRRNGYSYRSFLLSPVEFGIPNHRKRFYLLAERDSKRWTAAAAAAPSTITNLQEDEGSARVSRGEGHDILGDSSTPSKGSQGLDENDGDGDEARTKATGPIVHGITSLSAYDTIAKRPIYKVGRYIQEDNYYFKQSVPSTELGKQSKATADTKTNANDDIDIDIDHRRPSRADPYVVPNKILSKAWSMRLGIASANDTATHCFTAGYGRIYHRSTGSLLLRPDSKSDAARGGKSLEALPLDRSDMTVYEDQLRRFTPDELLRLFGFVDVVDNDGDEDGKNRGRGVERRRVFEIPPPLVPSLEQRYKLIGNSINATVVTELMYELLLDA